MSHPLSDSGYRIILETWLTKSVIKRVGHHAPESMVKFGAKWMPVVKKLRKREFEGMFMHALGREKVLNELVAIAERYENGDLALSPSHVRIHPWEYKVALVLVENRQRRLDRAVST